MPIFASEPDYTSLSRSLELFTDRAAAQRLFCRRLHGAAGPRILYFHGIGGAGKTLLLHYLRRRACTLLPSATWRQIDSAPTDEEFAERLGKAQAGTAVASTWLDFGVPPRGEDRPQESFAALLMLRRQLGALRLSAPLFDFAALWYLTKTQGAIPQERLRQLFPAEALEWTESLAQTVIDLADVAVPGIGLAKKVIELIGQRLNQRFSFYRAKLGLDEATVRIIQRLEPEPDLMDALPRLLAQDLNAALAAEAGSPSAASHLVLFFDTHEALVGAHAGHIPPAERASRDGWLRCFLGHLDLEQGRLLAVLAGHDTPAWDEAATFAIPAAYVETWAVGELSHLDSVRYLARAGVADASLRNRLAQFSGGHPYYLGLAAEVVAAAAQHGQPLSAGDFNSQLDRSQKHRLLVQRLLKYLDDELQYAVEVVSAARAFDWQIYRYLAGTLHFPATLPAFQRLLRFSFVQPVQSIEAASQLPAEQPAGQPGPSSRYRIHDLLRRLLAGDHVTSQASDLLESYYRGLQAAAENAGESAEAEAIYYLSRRDLAQGVQAWCAAMEQAWQRNRLRLCQALHSVSLELQPAEPFWQARMAYALAEYLADMARYADAATAYHQAIAAFDAALALAPATANILNSKSKALRRLADLQTRLAQHKQAESTYDQAIALCDAALILTPADHELLNSKGSALASLAELQARLAQHSKAQSTYDQAIAAYDAALILAPADHELLNRKGSALTSLAELQARLAQHKQAESAYHLAIAAFDAALILAPDTINILNNKGNALVRLADLLAIVAQHGKAESIFAQAIAAYDAALALAPDYHNALNNKGNALLGLANMQARLTLRDKAESTYLQAIAAYDAALALAPGAVNSLNNKGNALQALAVVQAKLAQHDQAESSYYQAIAAYDTVLALAPAHINAHINKGNALQRLANLQAGVARHDAAESIFGQAIATYDAALALAPAHVNALNNKGNALLSLAELQAGLAQHEAAESTYLQAIAALDAALALAPAYISALSNKGDALASLAKLQAGLGQHEAAESTYHQAIAALDAVIALAADDNEFLNNKGIVLASLAELQAEVARHYDPTFSAIGAEKVGKGEAESTYHQAIAAFDAALALVPAHPDYQRNREQAQHKLDEVRSHNQV